MKRSKNGTIALLSIWGFGLVAPVPPASAGQEPRTAAEQFKALKDAYDAPLSLYLNDARRARAAATPFLKLAREQAHDPVSLEALHWVVTHTLYTPMAGEAMTLLAKDHGDDIRIEPILRELDALYGDAFRPMERLLLVAEKSPHSQVRGWARLALGRYRATQVEKIVQQRNRFSLFAEGLSGELDAKPAETDADVARLASQAEKWLVGVATDYRDIDSLGGAAEKDRAALHAFMVGATAQDIFGRDAEGKQFKLSDYRGRVVVLVFWNHEESPVSRALYPQLRALKTRFNGRPFEVVGVNCGDNKRVLSELIRAGHVTWRFWTDEDAESRITRDWHKPMRPSVYVIDAGGVIRAMNRYGDQLVGTLDELMKGMPRQK